MLVETDVLLEHRPHLLRDRHEAIAEHFEPDGIGLRQIDDP